MSGGRYVVLSVLFLCWLMGGALSGCPVGRGSESGGDGGEGVPEAQAPRVRLILQPDPANPVLPFPMDLMTRDDPSSPTGLRPHLQKSNTSLIDGGLFLFNDVYQKLLNGLDGWSAFGSILLPLSGPVDTSQLPQDAAAGASPKKSDPLLLVNVQDGSSQQGVLVPITVRYRETEDAKGHILRFLQVRPIKPLLPRTRYLLLVTNKLRDEQGGAVGPPPAFLGVREKKNIPSDQPGKEALEKLKKQLDAPWKVALQKTGLASSEVILAFPLTTGTTVQRLVSAWESVKKDPAWNTLQPTWDPDGDGKKNIYYDPTKIPHTRPNPRTKNILAVLEGSVQLPEFRGKDKVWVLQKGRPQLQKNVEIRFLLMLPRSIEQAPAPVVIFQHGLARSKEDMLVLADAMAAKGIALVSMDAVAHGSRTDKRQTSTLEFMNFTEGAPMVANFRQNVIDHLLFQRMVQSFDRLDLVPLDKPDGKPDFLTARKGYIGQSLGSIMGGILVSFLPKRATVLSVGGGGFEDLIMGFLGKFLPTNPLLSLQASLVFQTALNEVDPVNYNAWLFQRKSEAEQRQVLLLEAMKDNVMPNPATENLARALHAPLLRPFVTAIPGLPQQDTPASRLGLFQYPKEPHGFLMDTSYGPATVAAHQQIAEFFAAFFKKGEAQISNHLP